MMIIPDYDAVGIGDFKRVWIGNLRSQNKITIAIHQNYIPVEFKGQYESEIRGLIDWLRPIDLCDGIQIDLNQIQMEVFKNVFKISLTKYPNQLHELAALYLAEMPLTTWSRIAHWRYFVGFVRMKMGGGSCLIELLAWEWAQAWVKEVDGDYRKNNILRLNDTLQIVTVSEVANELHKKRGVYGFSFCPKKKNVVASCFSIYQSFILDLLNGDQSFTKEQLVYCLNSVGESKIQIHADLWGDELEKLISTGVVI